MATYTPAGESALNFGLLIDPPTRETRQTVAEAIIPGSNNSVVDVVGKAVTKIRGSARIDSFSGLKTFEGVVGTQGSLVYSEEPSGIDVLFVALERRQVSPQGIQIANVEFWIAPVP
jgi:hypothetical protein